MLYKSVIRKQRGSETKQRGSAPQTFSLMLYAVQRNFHALLLADGNGASVPLFAITLQLRVSRNRRSLEVFTFVLIS